MKHLKFILLFLVAANVTAQIDTTIWYPMHIGDKWEYYSSVSGYRTVSIIGDTLMPNGHTYFILTLGDRKYQRVDSNRYVMVYNESNNTEFIYYNLKAKELNIWELNSLYYRGVYYIGKDSDNVLQINLEWKEYRDVYIDTSSSPPDTIWNETVDLYWPRITKGLGVSSYSYGLDVLVGLEINGVGYGSLVSVDEQLNIIKDFKLYQNYPNPFNPSTAIKYSIPSKVKSEKANVETIIRLNVFDILGREVTTLVNKKHSPGTYETKFDASNLPSGMYFYRLQSGEFSQVNKMLLLK